MESSVPRGTYLLLITQEASAKNLTEKDAEMPIKLVGQKCTCARRTLAELSWQQKLRHSRAGMLLEPVVFFISCFACSVSSPALVALSLSHCVRMCGA
jgi:hypothetical protein